MFSDSESPCSDAQTEKCKILKCLTGKVVAKLMVFHVHNLQELLVLP